MQHQQSFFVASMIFCLLAASPLMAADLRVTTIEGVGGSLVCYLILTVTGDLAGAGDFTLDVEWRKMAPRSKRGTSKGENIGSQTLTNPRIDLEKKTLTFHASMKTAGEHRGLCVLRYVMGGTAKSAPEITTDRIAIKE